MKNFLLNTWVLAAILVIPFYYILPFTFEKFKLEIERKEKPVIHRITYADLNHDNDLEKISCLQLRGKLTVYVHDRNDGLFGQWNFPYEFHDGAGDVFFEDVNKNGNCEIYGFTKKSDSVFLSFFEPFNKDNSFKSVFIDRVRIRKEFGLDMCFEGIRFYDLNKDSYKELLFILSSGYGLEPRKMYCYDFISGKLITSPRSGQVIDDIKFSDTDYNHEPEIYGKMNNGENIPDDYAIPYHDSTVWLMIYDSGLNYLFPPLGFPGGHAMVTTETCRTGRNYCFISFYSPDRETISHPLLFLSDIKGRILKSDTLMQFPSSWLNTMLKKDDNTFYLIFKSGIIAIINSDLKILQTTRIPGELSGTAVLMDLNSDNVKELVLTGLTLKKVFILSGDLKHRNVINYEGEDAGFINAGLIGHKLFFNTKLFEYFITYRVDPFYYLQFPAYLGIYFIFALLFLLVKRNQVARIREKYEFMSQVRSLEMRAFHSQMDPHFTLNLFNIISSLLKKEKTEEALNAFIRFSKLIRQNLEHSEDFKRTLGEEMEAVESFLQISKLRFGDKIEYSIQKVDKNFNPILIPKMIVLTHVENAVKHGIRPKDGIGNILVKIKKEDEKLHISIEDDGIGRKKAAEMKTHGNGLGLNLLEKLIDHLNKNNREKITQEIIDLTNSEGIACGTKIFIKLPLNLS